MMQEHRHTLENLSKDQLIEQCNKLMQITRKKSDEKKSNRVF
jgi:hypothetical protein